ncbi:tyrosine-type recombinase/integrase [Pelagovum sp. HNIBRBA483]|uniref:tyrosine-type recombinase/integrase n=1 Tax=Pelagovum sp. HNIBRBA483 TaxID=3233341 RepID=UPI0034A3A11F
MPTLTKTFVEKLEVKSADYIVFDTVLPRFEIRVMPSGVKSYLVQYRNGGRNRRLTLGRHGVLTADDARRLAQKRLGEVAQGEDPSAIRNEKHRAPTMTILCRRFLTDHVALHCKPTTARNYTSQIEKIIIPAFGAFKVADMRRTDIAELHHKLRDTPYQANRMLAMLSKMFNIAELWGMRPDGSNPCRLIPRYKERKCERYLNEVELTRLGRTLATVEADGSETVYVTAAFKLLLMTGCRRGEIQTLKWEYVTATHLVLPDSKTGARRIPLPSDAHQVLAALPRDPSNPYVIQGRFPGSHITDLERPWRRIRELAQLEDVRIHDLRHTYASIAAMNGIDLLTLGKILGHTNFQTTQRYAHLADERVRQAADKVSGLLSSAIHQPQPQLPQSGHLRVVR